MLHNYPWAKGLNISMQLLSEWLNQAGKSDLLRWALANAKINELHYLAWAKNFYGMASLKPSFFDQAPNPQIWEKWGSYDWSASFMPVYEWESVLYIACIEKPEAHQMQMLQQLGVKYKLFLAPYSGVKKWWMIMSPMKPVAKQHAPAVASPKVEPVAMPKPPPPIPKGSEVPRSDSVANKPIPPNMNLDSKVADNINPFPQMKDEGVVFPNYDNKQEMPNIPKPNEDSKANLVNNPVAPTFDMDQLAKSMAGNQNSMNRDLNESPEGLNLNLANVNMNVPEGLNLNAEINNSNDSSIPEGLHSVEEVAFKLTAPPVANSQEAFPSPVPNNVRPMQPAVNSNVESSYGSTVAVNNIDLLVSDALSQLLVDFDQAVVLLNEGLSLKPWRWQGNWSINATDNLQVDLLQRSIFKVVNQSKKPYNGYVVPNEINGSFFGPFLDGMYPEHCTIIPIIVNGDVLGMMMGLCNKSRGQSIDLDKFEKLGEQFATNFLQMKQMGRAA